MSEEKEQKSAGIWKPPEPDEKTWNWRIALSSAKSKFRTVYNEDRKGIIASVYGTNAAERELRAKLVQESPHLYIALTEILSTNPELINPTVLNKLQSITKLLNKTKDRYEATKETYNKNQEILKAKKAEGTLAEKRDN